MHMFYDGVYAMGGLDRDAKAPTCGRHGSTSRGP